MMKKNSNLNASLVISTYNWAEALQLVLKSVLNQNVMPIEIIIADDGSTKATKNRIDTFRSKFSIPIHHIWQADKGFRKSMIINKAIASAKGNYIIQVDGDCIMHRSFIKDHLRYAKKGLYLSGSRVSLKKPYLKSLFNDQKIKFNALSKGLKKRGRALHLPILSSFYKNRKQLNLRKYQYHLK